MKKLIREYFLKVAIGGTLIVFAIVFSYFFEHNGKYNVSSKKNTEYSTRPILGNGKSNQQSSKSDKKSKLAQTDSHPSPRFSQRSTPQSKPPVPVARPGQTNPAAPVPSVPPVPPVPPLAPVAPATSAVPKAPLANTPPQKPANTINPVDSSSRVSSEMKKIEQSLYVVSEMMLGTARDNELKKLVKRAVSLGKFKWAIEIAELIYTNNRRDSAYEIAFHAALQKNDFELSKYIIDRVWSISKKKRMRKTLLEKLE